MVKAEVAVQLNSVDKKPYVVTNDKSVFDWLLFSDNQLIINTCYSCSSQ